MDKAHLINQRLAIKSEVVTFFPPHAPINSARGVIDETHLYTCLRYQIYIDINNIVFYPSHERWRF